MAAPSASLRCRRLGYPLVVQAACRACGETFLSEHDDEVRDITWISGSQRAGVHDWRKSKHAAAFTVLVLGVAKRERLGLNSQPLRRLTPDPTDGGRQRLARQHARCCKLLATTPSVQDVTTLHRRTPTSRGGAFTGLMVVAVLLAAGCGDSTGARAASDRLQVVTTVAPLTSIAANVAGDLADVTGIVPEGTNSHTFEPAPKVARTMERADVVFVNGLQLEEPTLDLAEANAPDDARIVELGTEVLPESDWIFDFSFPKEDGKPNPHLWTDPTYAEK